MKRVLLILSAASLLLALGGCTKKASVGVIGGADGPTVTVVSGPGEKSSLSPEEMLALAQSVARDKGPVETLYDLIGKPASVSYVSSCLGEGEDGQLSYEGFTVYTYKDAKGNEAVQDVLED